MTKSGHRVRHKRVDEKTGREVDYGAIVKGYELNEGQGCAGANRKSSTRRRPSRRRRIEIEDFVDLAEIDPIYYNSSYYLAPRKEAGADKAYALLRDAMEHSGKAAIGRFVMRTKQYLVAIRAVRQHARARDVVLRRRDPRSEGWSTPPARLRGNTKELKIAEQLIDSRRSSGIRSGTRTRTGPRCRR